MTVFQPDFDAIVQAVVDLDVSVLAKESGAGLAEHWLRECTSDTNERVVGVEMGFVMELDAHTLAIGVQDLITEDNEGTLASEWKSTGAPSRYHSESKWLNEIKTGPQVALYALALRDGVYYEKLPIERAFRISSPRPRIRVRAISKSSPPEIWPVRAEKGYLTFSDSDLAAVRSAYCAKAEAIRALRRSRLVPWQLPGKHCFAWNRECALLEKFCGVKEYRTYPEMGVFDSNDPAAQASLPYISPERLADPDLVVLSASAYTAASECPEKYRNAISGQCPEAHDESAALDIGTCLHAALAQHYRSLRDWQEKNVVIA